jgi:hypothetical protein
MKGPKKQPQGAESSVPGIDLGQLQRLLSFMSEHGLEEFEYAHGDLRIRLKKALTQGAAPVFRALPEPVAESPRPQLRLPRLPLRRQRIIWKITSSNRPSSGRFMPARARMQAPS